MESVWRNFSSNRFLSNWMKEIDSFELTYNNRKMNSGWRDKFKFLRNGVYPLIGGER